MSRTGEASGAGIGSSDGEQQPDALPDQESDSTEDDAGGSAKQIDYWGGTPSEPDLGPHKPEEQYDDRMLPGEDEPGEDFPVTFGDSNGDANEERS